MSSFIFDEPDQYANGTPYNELAKLRATAPFSWHPSGEVAGQGFWLATRHQDVVAISKNPEVFATTAPLLGNPIPRELWPHFPALRMIADNLLTYDYKKHPAFRALATSLFTTQRITRATTLIRQICEKQIRQFAGAMAFDFAEDVALPCASKSILGQFLGVPSADLEMISKWILTINAMDDPIFRPEEDSFIKAAEQLYLYGMTLFDRKRKMAASDDAFSQIVHNCRLEDTPPDQVFLAFWFPLAAGAFDTTASTIAGGTLALIQHPEQFASLRSGRVTLVHAVDEMLRWVSPVVYFSRTATRDTNHSGYPISKGQKIVLCYASANRDEAAFRDPDKFDVGRESNAHVTFGHGSHFCVGARLALTTLRIFFEEYMRWMPALEVVGSVRRTRSFWMNRIWSMQVRSR